MEEKTVTLPHPNPNLEHASRQRGEEHGRFLQGGLEIGSGHILGRVQPAEGEVHFRGGIVALSACQEKIQK